MIRTIDLENYSLLVRYLSFTVSDLHKVPPSRSTQPAAKFMKWGPTPATRVLHIQRFFSNRLLRYVPPPQRLFRTPDTFPLCFMFSSHSQVGVETRGEVQSRAFKCEVQRGVRGVRKPLK